MPTVAGTADSQETPIWNEALRTMQSGGFKDALNLLLAAASSQQSERGRCRYRFLVAKLCLKAGHPELARPIVEQLNTMISELQLEKWESPFWISEILEALYQCLTSAEGYEEDVSRANELFRRICTMDVTKALGSTK
jgi:type VI secretion system protein ImpA